MPLDRLGAMAAGAAVVASDLNAFRRVLDDGRAGRLVPTGSAEGLATAVIELLGAEEEDSPGRRRDPNPGQCDDDDRMAERVGAVDGAGPVGEHVVHDSE